LFEFFQFLGKGYGLMNNKLAILYGVVIFLLVLVRIFTFFSKEKGNKSTVASGNWNRNEAIFASNIKEKSDDCS
jgi:hypothetical protein